MKRKKKGSRKKFLVLVGGSESGRGAQNYIECNNEGNDNLKRGALFFRGRLKLK